MADLIFSKYSNERSRSFAVRTDILEEAGLRYVEKTALYPKGQQHVEQLLRWYQELDKMYRKEGISCNRCEKTNGGVRLEYVQGQTLEEMLDNLLQDGKTAEAQEALENYLTQVKKIYDQEPFSLTPEFQAVFGDTEVPEGMTGAKVTNIDMVCENLVLTQTPCVLDYEWTFDFPVPSQFVLYRIIHYYVNTHSIRAVLSDQELYREFGITEAYQNCFEKMEEHFQSYITGGHIPIRELYGEMSPGINILKEPGKEYLQVYFSCGEGYREETSCTFEMTDGAISCTMEVPKGCIDVRIDPGDKPCVVKLDKIAFDGVDANLLGVSMAEGFIAGKWAYIATEDPWIGEVKSPAGAKELLISLTAYQAPAGLIARMKEMVQKEQENQALRAKIQQQAQLIKEMKSTKVWKFYQKYKKMTGRRKKHE